MVVELGGTRGHLHRRGVTERGVSDQPKSHRKGGKTDHGCSDDESFHVSVLRFVDVGFVDALFVLVSWSSPLSDLGTSAWSPAVRTCTRALRRCNGARRFRGRRMVGPAVGFGIMPTVVSRRALLGAGLGLLVAGVAGCSGETSGATADGSRDRLGRGVVGSVAVNDTRGGSASSAPTGSSARPPALPSASSIGEPSALSSSAASAQGLTTAPGPGGTSRRDRYRSDRKFNGGVDVSRWRRPGDGDGDPGHLRPARSPHHRAGDRDLAAGEPVDGRGDPWWRTRSGQPHLEPSRCCPISIGMPCARRSPAAETCSMQLTGSPGSFFRTSSGQHASQMILDEAGAAGYPVCLSYDVDPEDWTDPGAAAARSGAAAATAGSIVSLHFGHPGTVQALPGILDDLAGARTAGGHRERVARLLSSGSLRACSSCSSRSANIRRPAMARRLA